MYNFTLHNPTRLLFGKGQIAALDREIPRDAKVLLTAGGGSIRANGVLDQVMSALGSRSVELFWGIEPNPRFETLMKAVNRVREAEIDFLLAVGGGSVLDGTKFIAAAARFQGDPWLLCQRKAMPSEALPIGAVMTLPATGSEMNPNAVVTREETHQKLAFGHPLLFPRFSILDPETTFSLPPRQIANGVVDAFVHVMEQYLTFPADAPLQDRFAEGILHTLVEEGPKTLANPSDYASRANLMFAATMALNGLIGVGVPQDWSTHYIGHELTALYGLDHAQTLAIVLPELLWVQRHTKEAKLLQFGERLWQVCEGDVETRIRKTLEATRAFFERMGQGTRLSAYGVTEDPADAVVQRLEARHALPMGEHKDLDAAKVRAILTAAR